MCAIVTLETIGKRRKEFGYSEDSSHGGGWGGGDEEVGMLLGRVSKLKTSLLDGAPGFSW